MNLYSPLSSPSPRVGAYLGPVTRAVPVQPVVRRVLPDRAEPNAQPTSTTYTPQSKSASVQPLYGRNGEPVASSGSFAPFSLNRTDALELQVQTAEGDVATLRFSQTTSTLENTVGIRSTTGLRGTAVRETSQTADLQVLVQGQLSSTEQASIDTLAERVFSVANDFFDGDTAGALRTADSIDISSQSEILSAYAFSLESRETRIAAAMYDDIGKSTGPLNVAMELDRPTPAGIPELQPSGNGTISLLKELQALFNRLVAPDRVQAAS